ncbi:hypothetical protein O6H91_05G088800 [Diphasiastrum complanatum]|uniref:Uncharacterized protein n=1 Tax=Diphasiastrum complanatum TaxID=34168 RepID=A0ACC2DQM1_DIPCM|nr:hypothetical protein O6H91_05G088800 [Diphasiastrum complanatum]
MRRGLGYILESKDSKVLKIGKCPKLSPRYARPFRIVKKLHRNAYQLELPQGVKVHLVFHISCLKERLGGKDDLILQEDLVWLEDLISFVPIEPQAIVDVRQRGLKNRQVTEYLVHWKGSSEDDDTWEKELDLKQRFLGFLP